MIHNKQYLYTQCSYQSWYWTTLISLKIGFLHHFYDFTVFSMIFNVFHNFLYFSKFYDVQNFQTPWDHSFSGYENIKFSRFKSLRIFGYHIIQQLSGFDMMIWCKRIILRNPKHHIIRITYRKKSLCWFRSENRFFTVLIMINYMKFVSDS